MSKKKENRTLKSSVEKKNLRIAELANTAQRYKNECAVLKQRLDNASNTNAMLEYELLSEKAAINRGIENYKNLVEMYHELKNKYDAATKKQIEQHNFTNIKN
jgi:uncharacterized coiled-coil DUF342 family protein